MKISKNIYIATLLCLFTCLVSPLSAQQLTAHRGIVDSAYNFWFYTPNDFAPEGSITVPQQPVSITDTITPDACVWDDQEPVEALQRKPLVIFLHGASLCGRNLSRVRSYGTLEALERGLPLDAYVLAPQNPGGAWNPARINRLVDWALNRYAIDSTRIYVLGMSLGGYGTIDYAATYPDRVAAAVALCGGGTVGNYGRLNKLPLCILHGTNDRAVAWQCSQSVVDGMKAAGDTTRLFYRLLPKRSHGDLARYFYHKPVYEWLFSHSLTDEERPVNRSYDFAYEPLANVYSTLKKPSKSLIISDSKPDRGSEQDDSTRGVHVVRSGDSLSRIAKKYHTNVARLCKINNIKRTTTLRIGQKIRY